ncbi:NAD(+) diphosphatase [Pseudoalteromonas sp. T1lg76]|uniref:NAD(+) diphosphatase n=1 Tax=Pseudoalteromonas sp. T1lg76 TaxID=2077103 RepID=UPI000CF69D35|nr:NAD(+) diphosphatase [Pseudoalteromonas sp. T1lg76]
MLQYSQLPLDRHSSDRKDPNWLINKRQGGRYVLINNDHNLFIADSPIAAFVDYQAVKEFDVDNAIYLGEHEQQHYFALDVSVPLAEERQFAGYEFVDIRKYGPVVDAHDAAILVLARGLCHWHKTHKFCGRCGTQNFIAEAGHARKCSNKDCRHLTFPRTDPAVIMLVHYPFSDGVERCLLGRQASWPQGVYSTLAGFVDPGETLEAAVAREVMEEAGVAVESPRYIASQPWPFPSSLMLGYMAKANSTDIFIDQDEISEARWFSRQELRDFGNWGDEGEHFKLPRKDSISRFLIDSWIAQNEDQE